MTWTCCGTDHSKGCPARALWGRDYGPRSLASIRAWCEDHNRVCAEMGYAGLESPEELDKKAAFIWRYSRENDEHVQKLKSSNGQS